MSFIDKKNAEVNMIRPPQLCNIWTFVFNRENIRSIEQTLNIGLVNIVY